MIVLKRKEFSGFKKTTSQKIKSFLGHYLNPKQNTRDADAKKLYEIRGALGNINDSSKLTEKVINHGLGAKAAAGMDKEVLSNAVKNRMGLVINRPSRYKGKKAWGGREALKNLHQSIVKEGKSKGLSRFTEDVKRTYNKLQNKK